MTDTIWADVSQFQRTVDDSYPHRVFAFRACDGEYQDKNFHANHAWARKAADEGKLDAFIVYTVFEPGLLWASTLMNMVGSPHPKMAVMIDAESWSGKIGGDHSHDLNSGREKLINWLHDNRKRVIGYGNVGDLNMLWPEPGDTKFVVAAYGSNPSYPGKIAHQYTSSGSCAPFGSPVDLNSADGHTPAGFAKMLGIDTNDNTEDDDTMIINIKGIHGERRGGLYLVQGDQAHFIGGRTEDNPGQYPMFTTESEIENLQEHIKGLY